MVLEAEGLKGIVIRPGVVYGRQGGLTSAWFLEGAYRQRALKVVGDGTNRWSMVHIDDLARGYVLRQRAGLWATYSTSATARDSTVTEMAQAAARAAGYSGKIQYIPLEDAVKEMGLYAECLALDQQVDGSKAMRLLSWTPRHQGFVDGIETYFASWKAWQEQVKRAEEKAA